MITPADFGTLITPAHPTALEVGPWLKREPPAAVLGFGPRQAFAIEAAGYHIPQDIAFAALDVQQARLEARRQRFPPNISRPARYPPSQAKPTRLFSDSSSSNPIRR